VRRDNVKACLLKHDWAYRWEHILAAVGFSPLPQLAARKARLAATAAASSAGYLPAAAEQK
jgi:hypothetical protein